MYCTIVIAGPGVEIEGRRRERICVQDIVSDWNCLPSIGDPYYCPVAPWWRRCRRKKFRHPAEDE